MLGKLVVDGTPEDSVLFDNPDMRNLVQEVSMKVIIISLSLSLSLTVSLSLTHSLSLSHPPSRSPGSSTPAGVCASRWWTAASSTTRSAAWLGGAPGSPWCPGTSPWTAQVRKWGLDYFYRPAAGDSRRLQNSAFELCVEMEDLSSCFFCVFWGFEQGYLERHHGKIHNHDCLINSDTSR